MLYVAQAVGVKLTRFNRSFAHFFICIGCGHAVFGRKNLARSHGRNFTGAVSDKRFRCGKNILRRFYKAKLMQHLKLKADFGIGNLCRFSLYRKLCGINSKRL